MWHSHVFVRACVTVRSSNDSPGRAAERLNESVHEHGRRFAFRAEWLDAPGGDTRTFALLEQLPARGGHVPAEAFADLSARFTGLLERSRLPGMSVQLHGEPDVAVTESQLPTWGRYGIEARTHLSEGLPDLPPCTERERRLTEAALRWAYEKRLELPDDAFATADVASARTRDDLRRILEAAYAVPLTPGAPPDADLRAIFGTPSLQRGEQVAYRPGVPPLPYPPALPAQLGPARFPAKVRSGR